LDQHEENSIPAFATELSAEEVRARLTKMSKRGKLPGYESNVESTQAVASVVAHGTPFDSRLMLELCDGELRFSIKMTRLLPTIFAALLVVTIWPGLPLTDAFLSSFEWYARFEANTGIKLWYWYLPLTILPAPFMWVSALKKSRVSAHVSAIEAVEKMCKVLG